jgi:hypothetical protein
MSEKIWIIAIKEGTKLELERLGQKMVVLNELDVNFAKDIINKFENGQKVILKDLEVARLTESLARALGVWD